MECSLIHLWCHHSGSGRHFDGHNAVSRHSRRGAFFSRRGLLRISERDGVSRVSFAGEPYESTGRFPSVTRNAHGDGGSALSKHMKSDMVPLAFQMQDVDV